VRELGARKTPVRRKAPFAPKIASWRRHAQTESTLDPILRPRDETRTSRILLFGAIRVPVPKPHRRTQPLQSEAANARKTSETAIPGVLQMRPTPIHSVLGLVRFSSARTSFPSAETRDPPLAQFLATNLRLILLRRLFHPLWGDKNCRIGNPVTGSPSSAFGRADRRAGKRSVRLSPSGLRGPRIGCSARAGM
jgi:hypothetical protein